jgi:hypothetical protein
LFEQARPANLVGMAMSRSVCSLCDLRLVLVVIQ